LEAAMLFGCLLPVTYAGYKDAVEHLLPNVIIIPVFAAGLIYSLFTGSLVGALTGAGFGFALGLAVFMLGAMGGGDVKLMAALGAWVHYPYILKILMLGSVFGVIWGAVRLARAGKLKEKFILFIRGIALLVLYRNKSGLVMSKLPEEGESVPAEAVPFGTCLVAATWVIVLGGHFYAV